MKPIEAGTTLSAILILFTSAVYAQNTSLPEDSRQQGRLPYEVIITPLVKRSDLRALITQVEKDFVKRFNELNIDDKYDIDCYKFTPTGSHIRREVCEPNFLIKAIGDDASYAAFRLSIARTLAEFESVQVKTPKSVRKDVYKDYEILQSKVEEMTTSDQVLKSIATSLNELNSRLKNYGNDD